jgi:hypothetical protein
MLSNHTHERLAALGLAAWLKPSMISNVNPTSPR